MFNKVILFYLLHLALALTTSVTVTTSCQTTDDCESHLLQISLPRFNTISFNHSTLSAFLICIFKSFHGVRVDKHVSVERFDDNVLGNITNTKLFLQIPHKTDTKDVKSSTFNMVIRYLSSFHRAESSWRRSLIHVPGIKTEDELVGLKDIMIKVCICKGSDVLAMMQTECTIECTIRSVSNERLKNLTPKPRFNSHCFSLLLRLRNSAQKVSTIGYFTIATIFLQIISASLM